MSEYIKSNTGIVKKDLINYVEMIDGFNIYEIRANLVGTVFSTGVVIGRYKNKLEAEKEIERIYMELRNNTKDSNIWKYIKNKLGVKTNGSIHIFKP